jgi:hypothetical protein
MQLIGAPIRIRYPADRSLLDEHVMPLTLTTVYVSSPPQGYCHSTGRILPPEELTVRRR